MQMPYSALYMEASTGYCQILICLPRYGVYASPLGHCFTLSYEDTSKAITSCSAFVNNRGIILQMNNIVTSYLKLTSYAHFQKDPF